MEVFGARSLEETAAPSPEPEGSDIVEVYSFNTGSLHEYLETGIDWHRFRSLGMKVSFANSWQTQTAP